MVIERFRKELGGARFQRPEANIIVVRHGDHDDGDVFQMGDMPYLPDHFESRHFFHQMIDQNQVRTVETQPVNCTQRGSKRLDVHIFLRAAHDLVEDDAAGELIIDDCDDGVSPVVVV